jgi:hypothetical protein
MNLSRPVSFAACALAVSSVIACSAKSPDDSNLQPTGSEVAVSLVSGGINTTGGSGIAFEPKAPERGAVERALAVLNPIGTANAATWSCASETLTPAFSGPGADPYAFTPPSCSVTWEGGRTATSTWSGPFTLDYGSSCDSTHELMEKQVAACTLTRTTGSSGDTRSITGPDGNAYAIDHDSNGAGTGWDSSVTPAPNSDGVVTTCGTGGCEASRTLVINGSHLTGTVEVGSSSEKIWDHTVTGQVTVTGAGASRVVSGTVTVQHNLIHATSTTTFTEVGYAQPLCCFPTNGSVTTTFSEGSDVGKTESIQFSGICGETVLTRADGSSAALTLEHCL